MRTSVRSRRRWRMTSCPAAMGMRWVKPSSATVSPSCTRSATAELRVVMAACWLTIRYVLIQHDRAPCVHMGGRSHRMTPRTSPPFRADHVGSLLRPKALLKAREDHAAGKLDDESLKQLEDEAIADVVKMQREVGLQSVTDGEFRRASWHMDFIYSIDGISKAPGNLSVQFHNAEGDIEFTPAALHIDGKLGVSETIFADAFSYLQSQASDGQVPKLTIPSPSMVHYRGGRAAVDEDVYPDMDQFWVDLTSAYAEQVRRLGELGCTYLQFDDTSLAYLNDPRQREMLAQQGSSDVDHLHEAYISHINEALAGKPVGMSVTTHMCRGGRLRLRRRVALQPARRRRLLQGVGRRALGRLRASALRAQGQARRPRAGDHQARRARDQGRAQAPDRGGIAVRRPRPAVPVAAMRFLLDLGGQR